MPINPSVRYGVFGPEATTAMGEAFDAACRELASSGQSQRAQELVAMLVVAVAVHGELDPVRLRTAALGGLSSVNEISSICIPAPVIEQ